MTAYNSDVRPDTPRNRGDYSMPHMTPVTPAEDIRTVLINRVSWSAVFAGVAMAVVVQLVLNLIGVGIGVAAIAADSATGVVVGNLSLGTAIWWTVSGIIASFIGGYTAGRLSGDPRESTAGWHGLTAWAASIIILTCLILAGAGAAMGGTLNTIGLNSAGITGIAATPQRAQNDTTAATAVPDASAATLEMQAQTLAQTEGIPLDEARIRVQQPLPTADTAIQPPAPTAAAAEAVTTADVISQGALLSAVALLLGALAAWFGGRAGVIKPTVTNENIRMH